MNRRIIEFGVLSCMKRKRSQAASEAGSAGSGDLERLRAEGGEAWSPEASSPEGSRAARALGRRVSDMFKTWWGGEGGLPEGVLLRGCFLFLLFLDWRRVRPRGVARRWRAEVATFAAVPTGEC